VVRKTVRLACTDCERQDHDGITQEQLLAVKRRWSSVRRVMKGHDAGPFQEDPALNWYTHLGLCPNCQDA
jgi:hypothetical protein